MIKHYGEVRQGRLRISNHDIFNSELELMEGKQVEVIVKKVNKKRTLSQNAYYWGVIIVQVQAGVYNSWGEYKTTDEVHEMLKAQLNSDIKVNSKGNVLRITQGTSGLSTEDFNEYFIKCIDFAKEWFGITIPLPNEN